MPRGREVTLLCYPRDDGRRFAGDSSVAAINRRDECHVDKS